MTMRTNLPALVMVAALLAGGCGGSGGGKGQAKSGSALNKPFVSMTEESIPFPVGQEWDHTEVDIVNVSHEPVVLRRVVLLGQGIGPVARVLGNWAAPIGTPQTTVPSALYHRFPPAFSLSGGGCSVQTLRPLRGFVLAPLSPADPDRDRRERQGRRQAVPTRAVGTRLLEHQDAAATAARLTGLLPLPAGVRVSSPEAARAATCVSCWR